MAWKKDERGDIWHNNKTDKSVIIQEGTNIVNIIDWKTGKRSITAPAPSRIKAIRFAKKYMRTH